MVKAALIACLSVGLVASAHADDTAPFSVTPPAEVVGDGRAVAAIEVVGGPATPGTKALPVPEAAWLTCVGASSLAATPDAPPSVLSPVVTAPARLSCVAHQNGAEARFTLPVKPPPPGLYARVVETDVRGSARAVTLEPFVWTGQARGEATGLRVATSEGTATARGGKLTVSLAGNAPRTLVVALATDDKLGAAFVPVTGVTTIPVESEPGASVAMWIAGRWFGPVKTAGKIAKVAIDVPSGITHGVARSTGRAGYVTDAVTDLKIPPLPRIAAVLDRATLRVEEPATLAVAIAGPAGRPAPASTAVNVTARRGTIGAPRSLGGGLWSVPYTGPASPGSDHITVQLPGDARAGTAELDVEIAAGNVAKLELEVAPGPHEPGAELVATARAFDGNGNAVTDARLTATLGGAPLAVTPGSPLTIRGRVPEQVPGGEVTLEIAAAGVRQRAQIRAGGAAASATVSSVIDGRQAFVAFRVRDRFGNVARDDSYELRVDRGTLRREGRRGDTDRARILAHPDARRARVSVNVGERTLAETTLTFEPPASAFVLGAWAAGGWTDNLGVLAGPHGGLGLALGRKILGVEIALLAGLDALRFRDSTTVNLADEMLTAARSITGLGAIAALRARVRLTRLVGVAVSAGVVPMRAHVEFDASPRVSSSYDEAVLGVRGQLHVDLRLGAGRAFLGASYGRARIDDGVVAGRIDGASAVAGYERWLTDFGW